MVERVAVSPVNTVLVTGESGTGKDLVARAVHAASHRARAPFVNITCCALPESLLESELFGHEAGAFASAVHQKRGLFEIADGGTVFLDEIAEMPASIQAKLLRFVEERAFRRVGGTKDLHADVRVIASTHRDLASEVSAGRFRGDLYYRLRVVPVHLPPLRERHGDVALLAAYFIAQFSSIFGKNVRGIEPVGLAALEQYDWPGNVRELKHALEHAVLIAEHEYLGSEECRRPPTSSGTFVTFRLPREGVVLAQLERSLVLQALEVTGWNQVRASRLLGLNRDQIRYRIEKFGLSRSRGGHAA
jgi:transcriptional regulator with GAF, ATPase, and Fis domain